MLCQGHRLGGSGVPITGAGLSRGLPPQPPCWALDFVPPLRAAGTALFPPAPCAAQAPARFHSVGTLRARGHGQDAAPRTRFYPCAALQHRKSPRRDASPRKYLRQAGASGVFSSPHAAQCVGSRARQTVPRAASRLLCSWYRSGVTAGRAQPGTRGRVGGDSTQHAACSQAFTGRGLSWPPGHAAAPEQAASPCPCLQPPGSAAPKPGRGCHLVSGREHGCCSTLCCRRGAHGWGLASPGWVPAPQSCSLGGPSSGRTCPGCTARRSVLGYSGMCWAIVGCAGLWHRKLAELLASRSAGDAGRVSKQQAEVCG